MTDHFIAHWAHRWGISPQAMHELAFISQREHDDFQPRQAKGDGEDAVQAEVLANGGQLGLLMRNNVGAFKDETGRLVRCGLMNETKERNRKFKSSDSVGIYRLRITPEMVGQVVGQFWAVECKHRGWRYKGDAHESAQLAFGSLVRANGGRFTFATGAADL